jgi:hypothetical protein
VTHLSYPTMDFAVMHNAGRRIAVSRTTALNYTGDAIGSICDRRCGWVVATAFVCNRVRASSHTASGELRGIVAPFWHYSDTQL